MSRNCESSSVLGKKVSRSPMGPRNQENVRNASTSCLWSLAIANVFRKRGLGEIELSEVTLDTISMLNARV